MSKYCFGCMEQYEDEFSVCPYCGFVEGTKSSHALHMEPGSILAERYIIGRSLGFGGFGVTYIGWDALLEHKVAIKEYLPSEFSTRMPGVTQVTVYNGDKREQFRDGLQQFVNEAKRLAKLNGIDNVVKVYDAFEENNTAYIVMEYLEGETLAVRLEREKTIEPEEAVRMLLPVIDALQEVHGQGILHRDLAPDNLFITSEGKVKVIDFGAARFATTSHSRSLTVIIKPGYSAEEQYRSRADQGSYTDVYSLGATLYKMVTGVTPPDAMERRAMLEGSQKESLEPITKHCKKIRKNYENAILNAMNIRAEDRTRTMAELASQLRSEKPVPLVVSKIRKTTNYRWPLWAKLAAGTAALAVVVFGVLFATGIIGFESNLQTEISIPADMTRVPSVVSNTTELADQRITEANLLYTIIGKEYSSLVPADYVLSQDVDGGLIVMQNSNINLTVSGGPEMTVMPDVLNIPVTEAAAVLSEAGFTVETVEEFSGVIELGYVISQSVDAGDEVEVGAEITLVISKGADPDAEQEKKEIQVPDLTGKHYNDIIALAEKEGFMISVVSKEYSAEHPENTAISQSPAAGQTIMTGDPVEIVLSMGKEKTRVPDVQFKSEQEAVSALEAQELKAAKSYEHSDSVAAGLVISQSPAAGSTVEPGETVQLVISKGPAPFDMPNVVGMTEKQAKDTLSAKGITVQIVYEYSNSVASGTVMRQSTAAGTSVKKGDSVTLTVSTGEKLISVPNVVGSTSENAKSTLENAGFQVTMNWVYDSNAAYNTVISQTPSAGSSQTKGTTVVLTASLGADTVQSISIISKPSRRDYFVGDTLDTSGLVLKAVYKSGKTKEVTSGFTCSPKTLNQEGTQTITVTYQGATATYAVTVSQLVAESITVISSSDVLTYSGIENGSCTVTAQVSPDGGNVVWESSNSGVASVNGNGTTATVTAVSEGSATITATYTLNGVSISDSCTITVQKAASTLSIQGLWAPESGTMDSFRIQGTLSSNYALVRAECSGSATSNALGIAVSIDADSFYFADDTYTADLSILTAFFIEQYRSTYESYASIAGFLGDSSVTMDVIGTCYDASGNSVSFNFVYVIHE